MNLDEFYKNNGFVTKNPNYSKTTAKKGEKPYINTTDPRADALGYGDITYGHLVPSSFQLRNITDEKYKPYGVTPNKLDDEQSLNARRTENQSALEQLGNSIVQGVVGVAGIGIAEGFADLYDIFTGAIFGSVYDNLAGNESQYLYRNPVTEWLHEKHDELNEAFPIYADPNVNILNGGLTKWSWYMSQAPSLWSFVSFGVPSSITGKIISKTAGAIGRSINEARGISTAAKLGKDVSSAANEVRNINNASKAVARAVGRAEARATGDLGKQAMSKGAQATTKEMMKVGLDGALGTLMANQMFARDEAYKVEQQYREAFQDMDVYNKFLENNPRFEKYREEPEKIINIIANEAATKDWEWNAITAIPITSQMYAMKGFWKGAKSRATTYGERALAHEEARNLGKTAEQIAEMAKNTTKKGKFSNFIDNLDFKFGSAYRGYFDAGWGNAVNVIAENEGQYIADQKLGLNSANDIGRRLGGYFADGHLWDAAVWGILGGMWSNFLGSAVGNVKTKYFDKEQLSEENTRKNQIKRWSQSYNEYKLAMEKIANNIDIFNHKIDENGQWATDSTGQYLYEEFATNLDKEIAAEKLFHAIGVDLTIDAMNVGNYDILKEFFEDKNVQKAFVDAGFVSENEGKDVYTTMSNIMEEVSSSYDRHINYIDKLGIDPYISRIIATENTRGEVAVKNYESDLRSVSAAIADEQNRLNIAQQQHIDGRSVEVNSIANNIKFLRDEAAQIESKTKITRADRAYLKRLDRAISALEEYVTTSGFDTLQQQYIFFTSSQHNVYDKGEVVKNGNNPLINTKKGDEYLESLGLKSDVEKETKKNEFDAIAKASLLTEQVAGTKLSELFAKQGKLVAEQKVSARNINVRDKDIIERAKEIKAEIDIEVDEVKKSAWKTISDIMANHDAGKVYQYINKDIDSIEGISNENLEKLNTAIDVLKLDDFGHSNLINNIYDMYVNKMYKKAFEELKNQAQNAGQISSTGGRVAGSQSSAEGLENQGGSNGGLSNLDALRDKKEKKILSPDDAVLYTNDEGDEGLVQVVTYHPDTNTYDIITDEGLKNVSTDKLKEFSLNLGEDTEAMSTVGDILSMIDSSKESVQGNTQFVKDVQKLLKMYIVDKKLKGTGNANNHYRLYYSEFLKWLYEEGNGVNRINKIWNDLETFLRNNDAIGTFMDGSGSYEFNMTANNASPSQLLNYITSGNTLRNSNTSLVQHLDLMKMLDGFTLSKMTPEELAHRDEVIANLKIGDKLTYKFDSRNKGGIVFYANNVKLGSLPIPEHTEHGYSMINDGWITTVEKVGNRLISPFIDTVQSIISDNSNNKELLDILNQWSKLSFEEKKNSNLPDQFEDWLSEHDELSKFIGEGENTPVLLEGISKIYEYDASRLFTYNTWKYKLYNSYNIIMSMLNEDNIEVVVAGIKEGSLLFNKEKIYNPVKENIVGLADNPGDFRIGVIEEPGVITISNEAIPERLNSENASKGRTFIMMPYKGSGNRIFANVKPRSLFEMSNSWNNPTIDVGKDAIDIVKKIKEEIIKAISYHANVRSQESYDSLRDLLFKVFTSINNDGVTYSKNSLFRISNDVSEANKLNQVTANEAKGEYIAVSAGKAAMKYNDKDVPTGIFIPRNTVAEDGSVIEFGQVAIINGREFILSDINTDLISEMMSELDKVFNNMQWDVNFEFVNTDGMNNIEYSNSLVSRDNEGNFIITIGDKTWKYKDYNDFLLSNNLLSTTVEKSADGKSNYDVHDTGFYTKPRLDIRIYRSQENLNQQRDESNFQKIQDLLKKKPKNVRTGDAIVSLLLGLERTSISKPYIGHIYTEEEISNFTDEDIVKAQNEIMSDSSYLEIYPEHVKFDPNLKTKDGKEAEAKTVNGRVTVGQIFMDLINPKDDTGKYKSYDLYNSHKRRAAMILIHERLHQVLKENENSKYYQGLIDVYNEFIESIDDGRADAFFNDLANKSGETVEKWKSRYKNFIFDDSIHTVTDKDDNINETETLNKRLEEFLIESITNKTLAEYLNSIEAKNVGKTSKTESLMQKIFNFLMNMLGIKINDVSLYRKEFNALADAMAIDETELSEESDETSSNDTDISETDDHILTDEEEYESDEEDDYGRRRFGEEEDEDDDYSTAGDLVSTKLIKHSDLSNIGPTPLVYINSIDPEFRGLVENTLYDGEFNIKC